MNTELGWRLVFTGVFLAIMLMMPAAVAFQENKPCHRICMGGIVLSGIVATIGTIIIIWTFSF